MTVWEAKYEDVPRLVSMARKFHDMSPHKAICEMDPSAVARVLRFMISNDDTVIMTNGEGAIGGTVCPTFFNPSKLQVEENFWWAASGGGELLQSLISWGHSKGASAMFMSTLENDRTPAIDRVMRRSGFAPIERRYYKEVI